MSPDDIIPGLREVVIDVLAAVQWPVLVYFVLINTSYLVCSVLAFFQLRQHRRRWTTRELEAVVQSPATPGVSVIAPAYNEQTTIVESMRSLLLLNYPQFEVICVNDGSRDETLARASAAFDLVEAPMAVGSVIPTARVRATPSSVTAPPAASPDTTLRMTRPRTSSITAAPMMTRASRWCIRPRSDRTRAVIPTEVAVSVAPTKIAGAWNQTTAPPGRRHRPRRMSTGRSGVRP